jgi:replication factor A1
MGKTAENFFGSSAHCYLYDKEKIFQLRFGVFLSVVNHCDIIVINVFDDIVTAEAPHLSTEPELHVVDIPLNGQAASSSSKIASSLDPTTSSPVPPSKTNANFSQQPLVSPRQPYMVGLLPSQIKRQLLFED